jgi:hypothetical protein
MHFLAERGIHRFRKQGFTTHDSVGEMDHSSLHAVVGKEKPCRAILRFLEVYKIDQILKPLTGSVFFLKLRTRSSVAVLEPVFQHIFMTRRKMFSSEDLPFRISPSVSVKPNRRGWWCRISVGWLA